MYGRRQIYNSFQGAGSGWGRFRALYPYRREIAWGAAGLGAFYVMNLEPAPVTGRLRFMIVPRWLELRVGEQGYQQTMQQFSGSLLPDNHPTTRSVKTVMDRVIKASGMPNDGSIQWKVHVIGGDYPPNAFVLPSGKVFVFESILPICRDQDGLATVLSHETAHQVCRHTAEQLSKAPFLIIGGLILNTITGMFQFDDMLLNLVLKLPASRKMETEADYVGLQIQARACFDPHAAVGLWQRMLQLEEKDGQYIPEFVSTHPASAHRIENIEREMPKAVEIEHSNCPEKGMLDRFWSQ